jgi:hypothetical protein
LEIGETPIDVFLDSDQFDLEKSRPAGLGDAIWGALFCLLADVEIRTRTGNAKGLQDALRAINRAGGTIEADWPLDRAIDDGAPFASVRASIFRVV